jgi:hypothetical protein
MYLYLKTFVFFSLSHSLVFRNDLNSRPVQISLHINNTNNFNFAAGQELTRKTDINRHRNEMNINTAESSDEQVDDDDDEQEENESTDDTRTDEDSTEETDQTNYPKPPNSLHNEDANDH